MDTTSRIRALLMFLWIFRGDAHKVEIPKERMEVVRGQMVVLQAWYSPNSDIAKNSVIWHFTGNESKQVINFSSGEVGHGQNEFTQRVGFGAAMPSANLSIYINDTQESDSGRYMCNVIIPGSAGIYGEVRLNVKVPPSPPVCTVTGEPTLRGNVTLSCKSSHGKPVPQYKWTKAAPTSQVFFSPMQKRRGCPPPVLVLGFMDERQGTLRLSNLTRSMSGKYVCRASNTAGSDSCSINLEVITSSNAGAIAAATLGSIVGLVAIVLFLMCILRRRRDTEEEIANEIKEDAQAPKRVSWAKSNTGSDILSKNGTLSSIATSPRPQDPRQPDFRFPYSPTSTPDTGSVSNVYQLRPAAANPLQGLPGYNVEGVPSRKHKRPPATNGAPPQVLLGPPVGIPHRTEGARPQEPPPPPAAVTPRVSSTALMRMGGVAVMVPAQSQAGSLV